MDVNTNIIFYNINRVANVTIRAFGWKYFQGALPFNHNEKCACGMEVNTHSHMFFECRRTKCLREQAANEHHLAATISKVVSTNSWHCFTSLTMAQCQILIPTSKINWTTDTFLF